MGKVSDNEFYIHLLLGIQPKYLSIRISIYDLINFVLYRYIF